MAKTDTGLEENVAAALSYVLGWITGLIFVLAEKKNKFVRFHAWQSIIVFGTLTAIHIINLILVHTLAFIPIVGILVSLLVSLVSILISIGGLIVWILLIIKAAQHEKFKLPLAGKYAEKLA